MEGLPFSNEPATDGAACFFLALQLLMEIPMHCPTTGKEAQVKFMTRHLAAKGGFFSSAFVLEAKAGSFSHKEIYITRGGQFRDSQL